MADINLKVGTDGSEFKTTLQELRNELLQLKETNESLNKEIKQGFEGSAQAEQKFSKELSVGARELEEQKLLVAELRKELEAYERSKGTAFSPEPMRRGKNEAAALSRQMKQLEDQQRKTNLVGDQFSQILREVPNAGLGARTFLVAISNNAAYFAESIKSARKEGESWKNILKLMAGQLFGFMGIINGAILALTYFASNLKSSKDETKDLAKETDNLSESLKRNIDLERELLILRREKNNLTSEPALKREIELLKARGATVEEIFQAEQAYYKERKENLLDEASTYDVIIKATDEYFEHYKNAYPKYKDDEIKKLVIEPLTKAITENTRTTEEEAKKQAEAIVSTYKQVNGSYDQLTTQRLKLLSQAKDAENKINVNAIEYQRNLNKQVEDENEDLQKSLAKDSEAHAKRIVKLANLESELARARIELMEDGKDKEKAIENERFSSSVESIKIELNEVKSSYGLRSKEYRLLTEKLETENRIHTARMLVIDKKYNDEREKIIASAQKNIQASSSSSRENEIFAIRERFGSQLKELDKAAPAFGASLPDVVQFAVLRQQVIEAGRKAEQDINNKYDAQALENERNLALKTIDTLQVAGADERKLVELKERLKLQITEDFARKRLELLLKQSGVEESVAKDAVKNYQEYVKQSAVSQQTPVDLLTFLNVNLEGLPEDKKQEVKLAVQGILADISKAVDEGKNNSNFKYDDILLDLFGISDDEADRLNQSIGRMQSAFVSMFNSIQDNIRQTIDLKQSEIDIATTQIDELNQEINRELSLKEKGYATNVALKQKEIAQLKAARDKDIADQAAAQKRLERIEKAKQASSAATTIASMIKSVASIIESATEMGGWIGALLGVAEAAAIVASFFELKNTLSSSFATGGEVNGKSHAEGGNKYVSIDGNDPHMVEIEKGEYVINRKSTNKYKPLIEAINNDELSNMNYNDLMRMISPNDVQYKTSATKALAKRSEEAKNINIVVAQSNVDNDALNEIAASNRELLEIEKKRGTTEETKDKIIITQGNRKRIIKKNQ